MSQQQNLLALRRAVDDYARLQLDGLPAVAVVNWIASLAVNQMVACSGLLMGSLDPLYLTELVAALARSSRLTVTEAGIAALAGGSAPGSLSAAIADRLDFVVGPVREALSAAALLGTGFAVTDLAIVLGRTPWRIWSQWSTRPVRSACWPSPATAWGSGIR